MLFLQSVRLHRERVQQPGVQGLQERQQKHHLRDESNKTSQNEQGQLPAPAKLDQHPQVAGSPQYN